ncbi:MAG TPA: flagellar basal body P-ring protein FlgI [Candidatus Sulfotelmatobacter sp.]
MGPSRLQTFAVIPILITFLSMAAIAAGQSSDHKFLIRDVASVEGIRYNSLIGYGLVVGLRGTGDKQQTFFTIQTLASILQRMGVEIPPSVLQSTVQVKNVAAVIDSRRVEIRNSATGSGEISALLARIEKLAVQVHRKAKVVVNECTGTVVLGKDVRLGAVSILHGSFSIEVITTFAASQPNALAGGETALVPDTKIKAGEIPARNLELNEGASVEDLVTRLQAIGATAHDVISILQAIKAAGALEADLEVI